MNNGIIKMAIGFAGAVGVIATGYFTYKSTLKYVEHKEEIEKLPKKEKIIETAKTFSLSISIGAVTVALVAAMAIDAYRQGVALENLSASAVGLGGFIHSYRSEIKRRYGDHVDDDICETIDVSNAQRGEEPVLAGYYIEPGTPLDELCYVYEEEGDICVFTTLGHIILNMLAINHEFINGGQNILYNTIWEYLHIDGTPTMNNYGYIQDQRYTIDFDISFRGKTEDGYKVYALELPKPVNFVEYEPYRSHPNLIGFD